MKVFKNFIYNFVYKILTIILPFITVPYVTRIFAPEVLGKYNYTASIATYFTMFGMLGILIYGSNQIAKNVHKGREVLSATFSSIYYFQLLTTLIATLSFVLYIFLFPSAYKIFFLIQIFSLISNMIDISWLFQGVEDFKSIVVRNIFVKLASVALIFTLIKNSSDIYSYILIMTISNLLSQMIIWANMNKYVKLIRVSWKSIISHLKPTISFFLPQMSITLYNTIDRVILGSFGGVYDVGIYTQAININTILISLVATLSAVLLPRMTSLYAQGKHEEISNMMEYSMLFNSLLTFPTVIGMQLINHDFVQWFLGEGYGETAIAISIVVFSLIPISFSEIVGRQTLIPTDNVKQFTISVMIGTIVSVVLNFQLIPVLGYKGAAITMVIVEIVVCICMAYFARTHINIIKLLFIAMKPLFNAVLTGLLVYLISANMHFSNMLYSILFKIVLFVIIYSLLLILTKTVTSKEISVLKRK
ncbi:TPA: flippase [Streptococcus suis]|nr:flippase [Streptococcus suis]